MVSLANPTESAYRAAFVKGFMHALESQGMPNVDVNTLNYLRRLKTWKNGKTEYPIAYRIPPPPINKEEVEQLRFLSTRALINGSTRNLRA